MTTTDRIRALAAASREASEGATEGDWSVAALTQRGRHRGYVVTAENGTLTDCAMPLQNAMHMAHHSREWTARNAKLLEALADVADSVESLRFLGQSALSRECFRLLAVIEAALEAKDDS